VTEGHFLNREYFREPEIFLIWPSWGPALEWVVSSICRTFHMHLPAKKLVQPRVIHRTPVCANKLILQIVRCSCPVARVSKTQGVKNTEHYSDLFRAACFTFTFELYIVFNENTSRKDLSWPKFFFFEVLKHFEKKRHLRGVEGETPRKTPKRGRGRDTPSWVETTTTVLNFLRSNLSKRSRTQIKFHPFWGFCSCTGLLYGLHVYFV